MKLLSRAAYLKIQKKDFLTFCGQFFIIYYIIIYVICEYKNEPTVSRIER
jgi:hypothetical protein